MSGFQRAQPSNTSLLSGPFPRSLFCKKTYHHRRVVSILLRNFAYERHASTGMRRAAGKNLSFPTARTKDGEAFASELVCEEKGRGHLGFGRRGR